jgi:hypothetical protein
LFIETSADICLTGVDSIGGACAYKPTTHWTAAATAAIITTTTTTAITAVTTDFTQFNAKEEAVSRCCHSVGYISDVSETPSSPFSRMCDYAMLLSIYVGLFAAIWNLLTYK